MSEFDKIIGYEKEKKELLQVCDILKRYDEYNKFGVALPKGLMLEGIPGVGKTLMAWALIKESGLKYFHVKKDKPDDEFLKELQQVFEDAKDSSPSIIFLDDVDKFTERHSRHDENQKEFVAIQSGMEKIKNKNVMVIATANDIDILPRSLKRSGRFDKIMKIETPVFDDAVKIVEHYIKNKKVKKDVNPVDIVKMMGGGSCADLENILNEAGIYAVFNGAKEIELRHFVKAVASVSFSIKINDDNCDGNQLEKQIAYHEAGHAVMAMLSKTMKPSLVSICKTLRRGGVCNYYFPTCDCLQFEKIEDEIRCSLAGRAAANIKFDDKSLGAILDNREAHDLLEKIITEECIYGYKYAYLRGDWDRRIVQKQLEKIDEKICMELDYYYNNTKKILSENFSLVEKVASELLDKKILSVVDLERIQKEYFSNKSNVNV